MDKDIQISAFVSKSTKELLETYVRASGMKKAYLVEQALRHHLQALQQLPAEAIIAPRIVVSKKSGRTLLRELRSGKPSRALRELMRDGD